MEIEKTIDLRPEYYKKWEAESKGCRSVIKVGGIEMPINDTLTEAEESFLDEILTEGKKGKSFLLKIGFNGKDCDDWGRNKTMRDIGERINKQGGFLLMQKIAIYAKDRLPKRRAIEIESVWDGIGEWEA